VSNRDDAQTDQSVFHRIASRSRANHGAHARHLCRITPRIDRSFVRFDLSIAIANRFVLDAMREPRERKPPAKVRVEGVCCMRGAVGAVMGAGGWWCANACDAMVIRIDVD
jgi:hypothetical protein